MMMSGYMHTNPAAAVGLAVLPVQLAVGATSMLEPVSATGASTGNVTVTASGLDTVGPFWNTPPTIPISVLPEASVP